MEEGIHDKEPKGTPLYMAPEVMLKDEITPKVDIYSIGIIMWEMYTRQDPFSNHDDYDTFVNAVVHKGERPPIPPEYVFIFY
jgi:serine/threonine protein kinase